MIHGTEVEHGLMVTNHGLSSVNDGGWTVAIDLCKVDALLAMLKQLDDQESAAQLMNAGNQVFYLMSIYVLCFFLQMFGSI